MLLNKADFRLLYINRTAKTHAHTETHRPERTMSSPSNTSNPLSTLAPKRKTKKKHFVQQKVEVFRASDPVLSVLMWGVNHSVSVQVQVCVRVSCIFIDFHPLLMPRLMT